MEIIVPKITLPKYPIFESKYFDVREYVDARTWFILGIEAAWMIDERTVKIDNLIREKTGCAVTINNWWMATPKNQIFDSSGYRPKWDEEGGLLSQHRCGRASDKRVRGMTPREVLKIIMQNEDEFLDAGLTTIENLDHTPSWLHTDCRAKLHKNAGILFVNP